MNLHIEPFFDPRSSTLTYVVWDAQTLDAVIIDPVLDYDPHASRTWTESVDVVLEFVRARELTVRYVLETHAHADHLSGSQIVRDALPNSKLAVGAGITEVQRTFKDVFGLPASFPIDGSQFDQLLVDGEVTRAGSLEFETIATPGHTPACVTYRFGDAIFTGDALFMPDAGTGRTDFPGGSATALYHSIHEVLYVLPDDTRVFTGHDYQPGGRELAFVASLAEHKERNVALPMARSGEDFVQWREGRDATLSAPKLLFQSVQVNVDGGRLPSPEDNEQRYLRIPINVFRPKPAPDAELVVEEIA